MNKKTYPLPIIEAPRKADPGPVGEMDLSLPQGVGVLRFAAWQGLAGVNHAFTTRIGGVSEKEFASLNLGFGRGDGEEQVAENYRRFCAAAGFDPESLVCGAQDHHVNIRVVGPEHRGIGIWKEKDMESIDGLCTDQPGVTLVIYCADCVPLYFYDPAHHAIGLAHAGWRGTAAGMAKVMTERLAAQYGTAPRDLRVAIGPSICPRCFEVGPEVAQRFEQAFPQHPELILGGYAKPHIDLWRAVELTALEAGMQADNITCLGECCYEHPDRYFSHRVHGEQRGVLMALIGLRAEEV